VLISAFIFKFIKAAGNPKPPMATSTAWQICSYNETSFSEVYDTPGPINLTRWSTAPLEFGWERG